MDSQLSADDTFRDGLRRDGFDEAVEVTGEAGRANSEHAHDYDVRGLVLQGEITLTVADGSTCYRPGDIFTMPSGCRHAEHIGPEGLRVLVGRRGPRAAIEPSETPSPNP